MKFLGSICSFGLNLNVADIEVINQIQLSVHLCSDEGLDAQAKLGLAVCARTLRCLRDDFSEVAHTLHLEDTKAMPEQSTMDTGLEIIV